MFTPLKEHGLSSGTQDAVVFSYPGANVQVIGEKFQNDQRAKSMDTDQVTNIIVLCGSNNVDSILGSRKEDRTALLGHLSPRADELSQCKKDIECLMFQLHKWAPSALIRMVNVLPRESYTRNMVITSINEFLLEIGEKHPFLGYISTEKVRKLFSNKYGFRKSAYFSKKGDDNIHLNSSGVKRLANHLKFVVHTSTQQTCKS